MKEIYKEDLHTDMRSLQDLGFESHEAQSLSFFLFGNEDDLA